MPMVDKTLTATVNAALWLEWHKSLGNAKIPFEDTRRYRLNRYLTSKFMFGYDNSKLVLSTCKNSKMEWFPFIPWEHFLVSPRQFTISLVAKPFKAPSRMDIEIPIFIIDMPIAFNMLKMFTEEKIKQIWLGLYDLENFNITGTYRSLGVEVI